MKTYTLTEIANELGVSRSTAWRYLKQIQAVPVKPEEMLQETEKTNGETGNKTPVYNQYPESVLNELLEMQKEKAIEKKERNRLAHESHKTFHEIELETMNETLYNTLVEQIKTKDEQLKAKDKQIEQLQKALDQSQQLQAVTENRVQLLEDKQKTETSAPTKESIWNRIKKIFE